MRAAVRGATRTLVSTRSSNTAGPPAVTATPVMTSCTRPLRRDSMRRASSASRGLPITTPSHTTVVSAPRTASTASSRPPATARALARAVAGGRDEAVEAVLGADTTVGCDGVVMGKPRDAEEARRMLSRLNGRVHEVITGVAVTAGGPAVLEDRVLTRVRVAPLTAARIAAYVASGEPMGKAGGYAIQGRAAAFVERIEGSYTNVVGLPLVEALVLLQRAGVPMP